MSIYVELEEKTLMETLDKLIQACFTSLDSSAMYILLYLCYIILLCLSILVNFRFFVLYLDF